jgi:pyruvate/2-oxoglutarate/acetoin dehydrogenase E1 component
MVTMTVREAINSAMEDEIRRDPKVFLIGKLNILSKN